MSARPKPVPRTRRRPREVWDATTERAGDRMEKLAAAFAAGKISGADYELAMRGLVKSLHMGALAAGAGGIRKVEQRDLNRIGPVLRDEYRYLRRRVANFEAYREHLASGGDPATYKGAAVTAAQLQGTVRGYAEKALGTFERAKIEKAPKSLNKARWVLNSGESCDDCIRQNARGVQDRKSFPRWGSLECGHHCKCELQLIEGPRA